MEKRRWYFWEPFGVPGMNHPNHPKAIMTCVSLNIMTLKLVAVMGCSMFIYINELTCVSQFQAGVPTVFRAVGHH